MDSPLALVTVYFLTGVIGKVGGAWLGAVIARTPGNVRELSLPYIYFALHGQENPDFPFRN